MEMKRNGFGQVEFNHMSGHRNGQVYAQLPCAEDIEVLENGQFVKYDYAAGEVNFDAESPIEWFLNYNEIKLYRPFYEESLKDFALQKKNFTNGLMTPRVYKTHVGDLYTTNCFAEDVTEVNQGDKFIVGDNGFLVAGENDEFCWQAVKCYTMPDGQPGVKLQRIK